MTKSHPADRITHHCPACNQPASCGHELGCERCWCDEFAKLPRELLSGNRCLCPACLNKVLEENSRQSEG